MTDRELLDALARDVAAMLDHSADVHRDGTTHPRADAIRARHARPVEPKPVLVVNAPMYELQGNRLVPVPPTPPADADDAGARLVALLGQVELDRRALGQALDLARTVIRQRDEARRALKVAQDTLRDALSREVEATIAATTRADAAEARERELRDTLARIASIAHAGGLHGMSESEALVAIRRSTLKHWSAAAQPASEGRADG